MTATPNLRQVAAEALAGLAANGDRRAARAYQLLIGEALGGRPAYDDAAALEEMVGHVEAGRSVRRAARLVARTIPGAEVEKTAARLQRKYKESHCKTS